MNEINWNSHNLSMWDNHANNIKETDNTDWLSFKSFISRNESNFLFNFYLFCNIFRSFIGLGILVFPHVVQLLGQTWSIISLIITLFIFIHGTNILFEVCDEIQFNGKRYELLIKKVLGNNHKIMAEIFIIFTQICCSIATLILTINFWNYIACLYDYSLICNRRNYLILFGFLFSFPMMFIKSLKTFGIISTFTTIIILISIFSILFWNFKQLYYNPHYFIDNHINFNYKKLPLFLGVALYSIEGIGMVIPLRSTVKNKKIFNKMYYKVQICCITWIIMFGFSSVYVFGIKTLNFLFFNFSKEQTFLFTLGVIYSIGMFFSFPLNHFPIYDIILNTQFSKNITKKFQNKILNSMFEYTIRIILLLFLFIIVYINPNFIEFLSLAGSVMTYFLSIFFPVLLYDKIFKNNNKKRSTILFNIFFLITGTILTLVISINSIINLI